MQPLTLASGKVVIIKECLIPDCACRADGQCWHVLARRLWSTVVNLSEHGILPIALSFFTFVFSVVWAGAIADVSVTLQWFLAVTAFLSVVLGFYRTHTRRLVLREAVRRRRSGYRDRYDLPQEPGDD